MDDFTLRSTQMEQALFEMRKVVVGQDRVLERLMMYERRIEFSLHKTMAELREQELMRELEQAEAAAHRGRDAHETQGRDAVATNVAGRSDEHTGENKKQSQSAAVQNGLCSFEKREYELLVGDPPRRNKANDSHRNKEIRGKKTEVRGQRTEQRSLRKALVCRY